MAFQAREGTGVAIEKVVERAVEDMGREYRGAMDAYNEAREFLDTVTSTSYLETYLQGRIAEQNDTKDLYEEYLNEKALSQIPTIEQWESDNGDYLTDAEVDEINAMIADEIAVADDLVDGLTDEEVNEILKDKILSDEEFDRVFNEYKEELPQENIGTRTAQKGEREQELDRKIESKRSELQAARNELKSKHREFENRYLGDLFGQKKTSDMFGESPEVVKEQVDKALKPYKEKVEGLKKELKDLENDDIREKAKKLDESQTLIFADKVRKAKIKPNGKAFDATIGLPIAVWNGAVETVATAIEAGVATVNAIKRGLNYIQKRHRGAWNKKEYNTRIIEELGFRGITVNGEDLIVKPIVDKQTAEIINGFYSPLEQGVLDSKTEKTTGREWLKKIQSVTEKDELVYTGIKDFLESNSDKQLTKADILDYLKNNRVQLVEVVKGDTKGLTRAERIEFNKLDKEIDGLEKERTALARKYYDENKTPERQQDYINVSNKVKALMVDWERLRDKERNTFETKKTKFGNYQQSGEKSDYKEVLVTLPKKKIKADGFEISENDTVIYEDRGLNKPLKIVKVISKKFVDASEEASKYIRENSYKHEYNLDYNDGESVIDALEKAGVKIDKTNFESTHFAEPNILVHLRMNTRTDADGNKVLFLEEVQSDFQQGYRKQQSIIDDYIDKNSAKVIEAFKKKGILEVICP